MYTQPFPVHMSQVVCGLCVGHTIELCKTAEPIQNPFRGKGQTQGLRFIYHLGSRSPTCWLSFWLLIVYCRSIIFANNMPKVSDIRTQGDATINKMPVTAPNASCRKFYQLNLPVWIEWCVLHIQFFYYSFIVQHVQPQSNICIYRD